MIQTAKHFCEPNSPWDGNSTGPIVHAFAHEVQGTQGTSYYGGDTVKMKCDICGHTWTQELAQ